MKSKCKHWSLTKTNKERGYPYLKPVFSNTNKKKPEFMHTKKLPFMIVPWRVQNDVRYLHVVSSVLDHIGRDLDRASQKIRSLGSLALVLLLQREEYS